MKGLHFNFKDLFRAPRIAFSLQRIWMNGVGLLGSYLVYLIFSYISLLVGGHSFAAVWSQLGLLPCAFAMSVPWYAWIIYAIGAIITIAFILMTNTAVARVVYMVLRNELFYTWTQAYKFAFKKWISVLGSMTTFIFIIAFFAIGAIIMGFIGRIPYIGELGTTLLTIPYIFSALLLFFIGIVFVVGVVIVPAIIATSDEDALGGVFQSFSITFNQPWRLVIYSVVIGILELVGIFIFAAAIKISYYIFMGIFTVGMGDKILEVQAQALYIIDSSLPVMYNWIHTILGDAGNWIYLMSQHPTAAAASGTIVVSGYIFAIFLLIIGGAVLAYGEAIGNSGMTLIYTILYKKHENENLLEREDEELKEEEEEEENTADTEGVDTTESETKFEDEDSSENKEQSDSDEENKEES